MGGTQTAPNVNQQTIPMFSPDGTLGDIPVANINQARQAGAKPAVHFQAPDGSPGWIPADQLHEATAAGGKMLPLEQQETQHPGFWNAVKDDAMGALKSLPSMLPPVKAYQDVQHALSDYQTYKATGKTQEQQEDEARQAAGHGLAYRALAPGVAQAVGVNLPGMEASAEQGDTAGVYGHTVVPAAQAVAPLLTEGAIRATPPVVRTTGKILSHPAAAPLIGAATDVATGGHGITGALVGNALERGVKSVGERMAKVGAKTPESAPIYRDATLDNRNVPEFAGDEEIEPPAAEAAPATTEPTAAAPTSAAAAPAAESKLAPTFRDATLNKRNIPEYAGEDFGDVVDQHIPPTGQTRGSNLKAKAEIDFYLKRGDLDAAQAVLDKAKPQTVSTSTPAPQTSATPAGTLYSKETPNVVPGTRNIQENDALVKDAENKGRGYNNPDRLDDKAIQQESNWDLEKQGYRSESEARREFIARNSTGTTKGELIEQANAARAAQPKAAAAAAGAGGEDLTQKLQDSLDTIKVGQGGVMTSAAPADLAKRWGVDPESLSAGREQTRGMSPEQTEQYINKLAESYKKGRPVEPVMETRDADNNIVSVDGRARAIAAQRAGIERIPIMIRRMPKPAKVLQ